MFLIRTAKASLRKIIAFAKVGLGETIRLSMKGLERGPHITRYYMYRRLSQVLEKDRHFGKILSISHSTKLCEFFDLENSQIVEANYPDYNILALPFADNEFDHVVSDQVLAHVRGDPQKAIDETFRVLKSGGLAVHTTCFLHPLMIDEDTGDFWRFSPEALALLCRRFSRIIEVGGWGNPYVWFIIGLGLRNDGIPEAHWHPLHKIAILNFRRFPLHTWVIAQK